MVVVADGTAEMDRRLERVLTCDPGLGVVRHADAGYPEAVRFAEAHGIQRPARDPPGARHAAWRSSFTFPSTAVPKSSAVSRAAASGVHTPMWEVAAESSKYTRDENQAGPAVFVP